MIEAYYQYLKLDSDIQEDQEDPGTEFLLCYFFFIPSVKFIWFFFIQSATSPHCLV